MIEHRNTEDVKAAIQEWQTFRFFFGTMCDFGFALFLDLWFWKMIYAGGVLLHVERFF